MNSNKLIVDLNISPGKTLKKRRKKKKDKPVFKYQKNFLHNQCLKCHGTLIFIQEDSYMELSCIKCSFTINNSNLLEFREKFQKFIHVLKLSRNKK